MKIDTPADLLQKINRNSRAFEAAMTTGDLETALRLANEIAALFRRLAQRVPLREQYYLEQAGVWKAKAEKADGLDSAGSMIPYSDIINEEITVGTGEKTGISRTVKTGGGQPAHLVFISYSKPDHDLAYKICSYLESLEIPCWIAPRNVLPGTNFPGAIVDAIDTCRVVVMIFSKSSNNSPHVIRELTRAVTRNLPIVPFRTEDILPNKNLDYLINIPHWLDAFPEPSEQYFANLADTIRTHLADVLPVEPPGEGKER